MLRHQPALPGQHRRPEHVEDCLLRDQYESRAVFILTRKINHIFYKKCHRDPTQELSNYLTLKYMLLDITFSISLV